MVEILTRVTDTLDYLVDLGINGKFIFAHIFKSDLESNKYDTNRLFWKLIQNFGEYKKRFKKIS